MADAAAHPTPKLYWGIALVLAIVTAVEIAIPSLSALDPIKVPSLLILGAIKFGIVVAFFMHLKFDKPLYRSLFLVGVIGAIPLFIVMLLTFRAF
jgi:cytochrome c oxidase subunit 4